MSAVVRMTNSVRPNLAYNPDLVAGTNNAEVVTLGATRTDDDKILSPGYHVVEYELCRRVIAFQNLRHGHLPLAALLQPDALVGLARCNRNAVPMHNQPVIDRDDTRFSCINL